MSPVKKQKRNERNFDGIRQVFGLPLSRRLDLCEQMDIDVGRIGYEEEGLRLTISLHCPYDLGGRDGR